jgi:hypothetical protein
MILVMGWHPVLLEEMFSPEYYLDEKGILR